MPDPESFLPLHPLEFQILLVVLEGASHGYEIVRTIESNSDLGSIYPANLYRRIRDLLGNDLLEEVPAPRGEQSEERRRYVKATALGRRVARAEATRLQTVLRDPRVKRLLQPVRS